MGLVVAYLIMPALRTETAPIAKWSGLREVNALLAEQELLNEQQEAMQAEIFELEKMLDIYRMLAAHQKDDSVQEIQTVNAFAGRSVLEGPGVELVLDDARADPFAPKTSIFSIVHDVDLLRVINELNAGGAEAIAINDQRFVAQSRVRCGGPTIHVKDQPLAAPYSIVAIGDGNCMLQQLMNPGEGVGIYQELISYGLRFTMRKSDNVCVPAYVRK